MAAVPVDLLRGDFVSAGLDLVGAIPLVGEVADTAKIARTAGKAVDAAKTAKQAKVKAALTKNAAKVAERSPIRIPKKAVLEAKPEFKKAGYYQIKYKWESKGYEYTSRWHTRTPNAPKSQKASFVVERRIPGVGYGKGFRKPKHEVLVGKNKWISWDEWDAARKAQGKGTITKKQKEWLDNGHWKY